LLKADDGDGFIAVRLEAGRNFVLVDQEKLPLPLK
jgi:hypothetical protein